MTYQRRTETFYLFTESGWEPVEGWAARIDSYPDLDLFIRREDDGRYIVCEARTSGALSFYGRTRPDALREAEAALRRHTPAQIARAQSLFIARHGLSPRYDSTKGGEFTKK